MLEKTGQTAKQIINNRYILQQELGQGGMGTVYAAFDRLTGQSVAFKLLKRKSDDLDKYLQRALANEFKLLSSLRHPLIVSVKDYGFDDESRPYFTMDLLPKADTLLTASQGHDLTTHIDLLIQLLQALIYLHRQGIIHLDLKPGNVLVVDGQIHVLDFGLATNRTMIADEVSLQGTLAYLAPEILLQEAAPSPQSDLYAVGIIAYEMLTGRHPFNTANVTTLLNDIIMTQPDLQRLPPPAALVPVIDRLLRKAPNDRYDTAQKVLEALCAAVQRPLPVQTIDIRESFLQGARLVGRDQELDQLQQALSAMLAGNGSLWLIGGESGIGKSRLLDELRTNALVEGVQVVRGKTISDGDRPYELWRPILRWLALSPDISPEEASVLKPLVEDIEKLVGTAVADAPTLDPQMAQNRLFRVVVDVLKRQTSPLLFILEDLHWAGDLSLALLHRLTQLAENTPLLLIGNYRNDEYPELPAKLPQAQVLSLRRLDTTQIIELTASMLGTAVSSDYRIVQRLLQETEGNPFFLVEIVRALAETMDQLEHITHDSLPDRIIAGGVQTIVHHRLAQLPTTAQPLLHLAATIGRQIDQELLVWLSQEMDGISTLDNWLNDCTAAAILIVQEDQWQFRHDKLRTGILHTLTSDMQADLHRQVAEALEVVYETKIMPVDALAYHWSEAGNAEKEQHYSILAGQQAAASYANEQALLYFDRALHLLPSTDQQGLYTVLIERETVNGRLGQRDAQQADLIRLTELADTPEQQIEVALRYSWYLSDIGDYDASIAMAEQAYDWATAVDNGESQAQALLNSAWPYMQKSAYLTAQQQYQQAYEIAQQSNASVQMARALGGLGGVAFAQSEFETAVDYHQQALQLRQSINDQAGQIQSLRNLGKIAHRQGNYQRGNNYYQQALHLLQQMGDLPNEGRLLNNLGTGTLLQGNYLEAEDYLQKSLTLANVVDDKQTIAKVLESLGHAADQQGQQEKAISYYKQSMVIFETLNDRRGIAGILNNLGIMADNRGRFDHSMRYYQQSLTVYQEIGDRFTAAFILNNLGLASERQGLYDQSNAYLKESLATFEAIDHQPSTCVVLANLGDVAFAQGQYETAIQFYKQGQHIAQESSYQIIVGIILNNLGAVALTQWEFQLAQAYYEQALALRQELNQPQYMVEDWAGLALLALQQGDKATAVAYARQLLTTWSKNSTFDGAEHPMRTLCFTWQACQGLGLAVKDAVLTAAIQAIQTHLDNHPDPEAQAIYLQQPYHKLLWEARLSK